MASIFLQTWFLLALGAAIAWGIGYNFDEWLMKQGFTPAFLMVLHVIVSLPLYLYYSFMYGNPLKEMENVFADPKTIMALIAASITVVGGNFLILYSISEKNATLASMIEISYPFFVALFAWLFFKEVQFNWWTMAGGVLVFCGIGIILFKN